MTAPSRAEATQVKAGHTDIHSHLCLRMRACLSPAYRAIGLRRQTPVEGKLHRSRPSGWGYLKRLYDEVGVRRGRILGIAIGRPGSGERAGVDHPIYRRAGFLV